MSESERKKGGCLKRGCLGCAASMALALLFVGVLFVGGRFFAPEVQMDGKELTPELPLAEAIAALPPAPAAEDGGPQPLGLAERGTLALELAEGSFEVRPAPPGSQLRVEADFDRGGYELLEIKEWTDEGDWTYRVVLRNTIGLWGLFRKDSPENRIVVHVPSDLPLDLRGRFEKGASQLELGTLDLGSVSLGFSQGAHAVSISEPTAGPLESFSVASGQGALSIDGLGNASPARAEIRHRMGALEVDLSGAWQRESRLAIHVGMGGGLVKAPLDVPLVVDSSRADAGEVTLNLPDRSEEVELARPVRIDASATFGELTISQR